MWDIINTSRSKTDQLQFGYQVLIFEPVTSSQTFTFFLLFFRGSPLPRSVCFQGCYLPSFCLSVGKMYCSRGFRTADWLGHFFSSYELRCWSSNNRHRIWTLQTFWHFKFDVLPKVCLEPWFLLARGWAGITCRPIQGVVLLSIR